MVKLILVSGLVPFDSGKTWFTLGSALYARNLGFTVRVFKPVAGHNVWYSPRAVKKTLELRALVGNDVGLYYEKGLVENPVLGNPIALATAPPDPYLYGEDIESYERDFENTYAITMLSRITDCVNEVTVHYFYPENLGKAPLGARRALHKLMSALRAEKSAISELLSYMLSRRAEDNLSVCLDKIKRNADVVFIESFNDAVSPYISLIREVDVVAIVAPGKVLVYKDVDEFRELVSYNVKQLGWEGYRSKYVVKRLKPRAVFDTELISKPKTSSVHKRFVESVLS